MIKSIVFLLYLIVLSIFDWKERKVPIVLLAAGTAIAAGYGMHACFQEMDNVANNIMELCLGMVPGGFLLLMAWLTHKIGYGDGVAMLAAGLVLGYKKCLVLLCFSMFLAALISVGLLLSRKAGSRTALPYLPFVAAAYLAGIFL